MSKLFWDHLVDTKDLEKKINTLSHTPEEKQELWGLVDEIIHHKVLGCILEKLPKEHHQEFLDEFAKRPHDQSLWEVLKAKTVSDIELFVIKEVRDLADEILSYVEDSKEELHHG